MIKYDYKIGVIGAAGAIAREIISILSERDFPVENIDFIDNNADNDIVYLNKEYPVKQLSEVKFDEIDILILAANAHLSQELYEKNILDNMLLVIDTTEYFRSKDYLFLTDHNDNDFMTKLKNTNYIASCPGSVSSGLAYILKPLSDYIKRINVSTYQPSSRLGMKGINSLFKQISSVCQNEEIDDKDNIFNSQLAFNAVPHVSPTKLGEFDQEELYIEKELKILVNENINISSTCVVVPTLRGDAISLNIEFKDDIQGFDLETAIMAISSENNIMGYNNDTDGNYIYPTPYSVMGSDYVYVGRIRKDNTVNLGLNLWASWDNVRITSLNVVNLLEKFLEEKAD